MLALVQAWIAGRSLRYMSKIGTLSAKLPEARFALIWPRRFHSQYPAGYHAWWSRLKLNRSARPAWLPGYWPVCMMPASKYRYRVLRFSMYWAVPSEELASMRPLCAQYWFHQADWVASRDDVLAVVSVPIRVEAADVALPPVQEGEATMTRNEPLLFGLKLTCTC